MMKKSVIAMAPVMAVMLGGFNCPLVTAQTEPIIAETPEYTVQEGDSLWKIVANQYPNFDNGEILDMVNAVADLNGLADVNEIFEGQVLQLAEAAAEDDASMVLSENTMPVLAEGEAGICNVFWDDDSINFQCTFDMDPVQPGQTASMSWFDYGSKIDISLTDNSGDPHILLSHFNCTTFPPQGNLAHLECELFPGAAFRGGFVDLPIPDSDSQFLMKVVSPLEDVFPEKPWALAASEFSVTLLPEVNDENCKTESVEKWVEENNLSKEEMSEFTEKCVGRGDFKRSEKRVLIP